VIFAAFAVRLFFKVKDVSFSPSFSFSTFQNCPNKFFFAKSFFDNTGKKIASVPIGHLSLCSIFNQSWINQIVV